MKERIIRLSELTEYHQVKEVYGNSLACFEMSNRLVNIDTIPPVFADIFSVVLIRQGKATFSLNYREHTVGPGDMLLFWPSLLVALTRQSPDFTALHLLCERTLFERLLATNPAYRQYPLFFCRTQSPILHLTPEQANDLANDLQQIARHIARHGSYQEEILHHLLHAVLLQVLEMIDPRANSTNAPGHSEQLFQQFIALLIQHYKREHYIEFYARHLSISPSYLSRIIRKTTHKTAAYFITGLLYAEACRLLRHTDLPIQAIADELNFSDQSAFGKFFKTNSGLSPLHYRAQEAKARQDK
ncbi:MAG TPA: AraC family transcriptional regulator [Candidatus Barnesiella merdipullorum]|nr:AraC family transcriptional regulator [Candidatus Barnesiella merdipullorum]